MSFILVVSIAIRLIALAWTVVLVRRARDWRLLFLTAMLALMATRQVMTLLNTASASPYWTLEVGGQAAESAGLVVSVMALFAVFALDGIVLRSKPAKEASRRLEQGGPALAPVAIVIGAVAMIGCITVGALAYTASRDASLSHIAKHNLDTAQFIDQHLAERLAEIELDERTPDRALSEVERIWSLSAHPHSDSYLCVVDSSGRLAVHTARPDSIGLHVGGEEIHPVSASGPRTIGDLVKAKQSWFGENLDSRGRSQLAGFAYSDTLDSLIAVQTSTNVVAEELAANALPWGLALALLAGVLIPLSLGLLHRSYSNAQRSLMVATGDLHESQDRVRLQAQLLSSVHESVVAADLDGTVIFWGNGAESLYGRTADETIGENITFIVSPLQEDEERERWRQVRETGHWSGQYIQSRKDGSTFWADTFISLVRDENGEPCGYIGIDRDITARKKAQEALQQTTSQLALMLDSMPVITYSCRVDGDFAATFVSRNAEELTGYPVESFTSEPSFWIDRVHPDDVEGVRAAFSEMRDCEIIQCDYRWRVAEGKYRWFHDVLRVMKTSDGAPSHIIGNWQDITERKESEEEMKQLNLAIENAMTGISRLDTSGRFIEVHNAYAEMLGYTPEQMIGMSAESTVHPEDREQAAAVYRCMVEEGKADDEVRALRRDGTVFMKHILLVKSSNRDGVMDGHYCFMRDVTERKRAAERLAESENWFRAIFESEPECVMVTDPAGTVVDINPSGLAFLEAETIERVRGNCIYPFVASEFRDEVVAASHAVFRGEARQAVFEIVGSRGTRRWLDAHMVPLRNAYGEVCAQLTVNRDITDRRATEEELKRRTDVERLLFRELDHRVRNNLSSLITLIDITGTSARDTASFATAIRGRVQAMATVHGMLTQSKWSESSLRDLATSLVPAAAQGDLVISGDEVLVPANQASSLGMVLHELFTNSLKYGALGADGARIDLACEVRNADDDGARIAMSWRESGGPLVEVKSTPGVGTSLIQGLVTNDLRGDVRLRFAPQGVDHEFTIQLASDDTVTSADGR